ncbi:MAG: MarR family transcriptional regulator [Pseudomonadota bacterium]
MAEPQQIAHEIDRVMRLIDAQMHKRMPSIDCGRIGPMGTFVMMHLEELEPCGIQHLARAVGRDSSQMTRLTRSLEAKGMIGRHPSAEDGRVTVLELTGAGRGYLIDAKRELADAVGEIVAPLTDDQQAALLGLLRLL